MPLLATRALTKTFGGLRAVDALDLHLEEGEILGVIGPQRRRQDHPVQPHCRLDPSQRR